MWKNIFDIRKTYVNIFKGSHEVNLKDVSKGAEWNNTKLAGFASSLSTKNSAFEYNIYSSLSNQTANWKSESTLYKPIILGRTNLPFIYNNICSNLHGTIVIEMSIDADHHKDSGRGKPFVWGFDIYLNDTLYSSYLVDDYNEIVRKNILNVFGATYIDIYDRGAGLYMYGYRHRRRAVIPILNTSNTIQGIKIDVRNTQLYLKNLGGNYSHSWYIETIKFYDKSEKTIAQSSGLAVAFEKS